MHQSKYQTRIKRTFSLLCIISIFSFKLVGQPAIFKGTPHISDPSVVGTYANTSFIFAVPTVGERPIKWTATNLPKGLVLDHSTGFITGVTGAKGDYKVRITATNKLGKDEKVLTIKIGDLLALTPPMGWNSWNTFSRHLSDSLVRQIADSIVSTGMRDLGYQYVNIDDFWQLLERDKDGNIQVNRQKFPDGIKPVADYVHSKGLRLGIYSDAADRTCGGVAGSYKYEDRDAKAFAEWGVDLLKYDYCGAPSPKDTAIARYTKMGNALKKTNRSIVFSICEWGPREPWTWAAGVGGNYWRTTWDIRNTWELKQYDAGHSSILQIMDVNVNLADYAGPGRWNDPDMLVVGIYNDKKAVVNNGFPGCSDEEFRTHMSLWCLMASPLLCGNDIRNMNYITKEILLNPEIIAIDQDELGKQARRIRDEGDYEVFAKPMADGSIAIGFLNRNNEGTHKISISWNELGIKGTWEIRDVWKHKDLGKFTDSFETDVKSHECVVVRISNKDSSASNLNSSDTTLLKEKLATLKEAVARAKTKGINTSTEDVTITTAGLFLNTFIPWDLMHPNELASAFSKWSKKEDLKGTPQQEAIRAPQWELSQTSEILDQALANIAAAYRKPESRRSHANVNIDHLTISEGFLSSDGRPVFSGGFIWGTAEMDKAFSGYIGVDVGFPEFINFNSLKNDGNLSDQTIADIVRHLDALQASGQKGSIGFGQSIPAWAVSQWPDIDDVKGHFFSYDIDHPQIRGLWKSFIASLVPNIRNHPAKFDYQLAIEPSWPSVGGWMVNNVSPYTFQKYQIWLGELYGNISALNISWKTNFSNYSDINFRPRDSGNSAMWYDWCRFNQLRVTDFFTFISDEIHKYDPDARCHMRISVGGVNFLEAPTNSFTALHGGIDREALVKMYEITGLDNFMQPASKRVDPQLRYYDGYDENAYSLRWLGHTILLDFLRSLGPDKLIYDSEWHSVSSVYCVNPEPQAGYMHTALWLSALHGLGATKTWYWSRNANGAPGRSQEEYYGSLLIQPRLLNEYGTGLAELNTFGKEVVALERAPKQIYLLYSQSSAIHSPSYISNQILTYEALQFTGLPTGFVTENELKTTGLPSTCKWLIVPDDSHVSQSTLDWLRNFIQEGGKLLLTGINALKFNEYGKAYSAKELEFLSKADKLIASEPKKLLAGMESLMGKTEIKRRVKCIDANSAKQTAFGVICRSVEYEGGNLVCLINVGSTPKEVSLEMDGRPVSKMKDLFVNNTRKGKLINIQPLETMLFQIN